VGRPRCLQPFTPQPAVTLLGLGEAPVELAQCRVRLGGGHRAVECRAVDLALQVGPIAGDILLADARLGTRPLAHRYRVDPSAKSVTKSIAESTPSGR
jgi:hypothetical protein